MKYYVVLLLLFVSCKEKQPALSEKLNALFGHVFKDDEPGGAVLLAQDGKIIYQKGFGIADIHTREKITPQTLFNIGSISKTFVAYGILQLARENKLSLDDDLYRYFPDFKNAALAKKIKIHHLLTHCSGLPDSRKITEDSIFYLSARDEENWAPIKQTSQLEFEPGERFSYSNPAFNGLALIIEKVSGRKWQDYIREKIMIPAGMKTSTITDGPYPERGVSHGYLYNGKQFIEKDYGEEPTFAASGNGGVWSSVQELWYYEQAIQRNAFLDSAWIQKSRTVFAYPRWKDSLPPFIGLCWFITTDNNQTRIGHTGSQGGFRADYVWLPQKKLFYVILCNTPFPLDEIRKQVFRILDEHAK